MMVRSKEEYEFFSKPWVIYCLFVMLASAIIGPILFVMWTAGPNRAALQALEERVGPLELGMALEDVRRQAGAPDAVCDAKDWFLDGHFFASRRERKRTARRWIYYFRPDGREPGECHPLYKDSVLGFLPDGRLIWFVRFLGESDFESLEVD